MKKNAAKTSDAVRTLAGVTMLLAATWLYAVEPAAAPPDSVIPADARVTDEGWFSPEPRSNPKVRPETVDRAVVIPIHEEISSTTTSILRQKIERGLDQQTQLIIFDMNTPGGSAAEMNAITQLILEDLNDVYTVAYIHPNAFSAGAIISLACDEIVLAPHAIIGDAMPIMIGPQGLVEIPEKERGKFESAMLAEIRTLANRNGYNIALCESMITITHEIWLIRNNDTRELRTVNAAEWKGRVKNLPGEKDPSEETPWTYLRTVVGTTKLLTMTAEEALQLGFGKAILPDLQAVESYYHLTRPALSLEDNWSEKLVRFLTSPAVTGLLMFLGVICLYTEINTPGFGIAGGIAIACFAIMFGSRYLIGMAAWWEIALFCVGILLILLEIFVIPGFGVAGITGLLACVAGLLAMLVNNPPAQWPIPETDLDWKLFSQGAFALCVGFVAGVVGMVIISQYLPKIPGARRFLLAEAPTFDQPPVNDDSPMMRIRVGDIGQVESTCRPVGKVRFGNELLQATSEGDVIEPGRTVRVLQCDGNRLVIEPVEEKNA